MERSTITMIKAAQKGNETAFATLYQLYYQNVYYTAYRICKSDDDAKEAAQLTFIQLHKSLSSLKEIATFEVWLHRIVVNKCYNLFAMRKDQVIDPATSRLMKVETEERQYLLPEDSARRSSDLEVLNRLLDELPEKYRTLLLLTYFHEHSMEEVSEILDLPIGTVKSRLFAARNLLKKKVIEYERVEGISLSFHEIHAPLISAVFAYTMQNVPTVIPVLSYGASLKWTSKMLSSNVAQGISILSLTAVLGVSAVGMYQAWYHNQNQTAVHGLKQTEDLRSNLRYLDEEHIYEPIVVDGISYATPQDAYFSLLKWAHCEIELQEASKEELLKHAPLYQALKATNSSYYLKLQESGWSQQFENLITKIE